MLIDQYSHVDYIEFECLSYPKYLHYLFSASEAVTDHSVWPGPFHCEEFESTPGVLLLCFSFNSHRDCLLQCCEGNY